MWNLKDALLITSTYALYETAANLETDVQQERLKSLMRAVEVIEDAPDVSLPLTIALPEKDRPILQAAISARATHLLTGDIRHFGPLFGKTVERVKILLPADYLNSKKQNRKKKK